MAGARGAPEWALRDFTGDSDQMDANQPDLGEPLTIYQ